MDHMQAAKDTNQPPDDQLTLIPTAQPGPPFDSRGIGRWGDVDLMAVTAIEAHNRGDHAVARMAILLPGVLERVVELTATGGYELGGSESSEESR